MKKVNIYKGHLKMAVLVFGKDSHLYFVKALNHSDALLCAHVTTLAAALPTWDHNGTGTEMVTDGTVLAPVETTTNQPGQRCARGKIPKLTAGVSVNANDCLSFYVALQ